MACRFLGLRPCRGPRSGERSPLRRRGRGPGIESNKPNAIEVLNSEISKRKLDGVSIKVLQSRYPQGAERVLAYEATGRKLDAGVLPADIGLIITNVATIAFIGQYMRNGIPLINKRLTVDGDAVNTPQNVIVAIGTPIKDLIAACGGYKKHPKKILMGGPMMGRAIFSDELPIIKNNNAILAFADEDKFTMPPARQAGGRGLSRARHPVQLVALACPYLPPLITLGV